MVSLHVCCQATLDVITSRFVVIFRDDTDVTADLLLTLLLTDNFCCQNFGPFVLKGQSMRTDWHIFLLFELHSLHSKFLYCFIWNIYKYVLLNATKVFFHLFQLFWSTQTEYTTLTANRKQCIGINQNLFCASLFCSCCHGSKDHFKRGVIDLILEMDFKYLLENGWFTLRSLIRIASWEFAYYQYEWLWMRLLPHLYPVDWFFSYLLANHVCEAFIVFSR